MASSEELIQYAAIITPEAAERALVAAESKASIHGWKVSIAISDAGGIPLLAKRCRGAFPASYEIAVEKAKTAALFAKDTGQLEAAANVSEGKSRSALLSAPFVLMRGGVPVIINGTCCGAVGVSGVTPEEDEQIAEAAVNVLRPSSSKL